MKYILSGLLLLIFSGGQNCYSQNNVPASDRHRDNSVKYNNSLRGENVFVFEPGMDMNQTSTSKLIRKSDMPVAVSNSNAISVGNKIYLVGGNNSSGALQVYSPETDTWETRKPFPRDILMICGVSNSADTIYSVAMTESGDISKYVIGSYNIKTDDWKLNDSIYLKTVDPAVAFVNNSVFIIGGFYINNGNYLNSDSVKQYNIITKRWANCAKLISERHAAASFTVGSKIYVFGGICFCNESNSILQIYDTKSNSWTMKSINTNELANVRGGFINNKIFMVARQIDRATGNVAYNNVIVFDLDSEKISFDSPIQINRAGVTATTFKKIIYLFGGDVYNYTTQQSTYYKEVYAYIPGQ